MSGVFFAAMLISSPALAASDDDIALSAEVGDERRVQYLKEWYSALHAIFNQPNANDGEAHEKYTFIVDPFFDRSTFISIEKRPPYSTRSALGVFNFEAYTLLTVSFIENDRTAIDEFGHESHERAVRDAYRKDISGDKFDEVFRKLHSAKLGLLPVAYEVNGCTDGTQSFLKMQKGNDVQFISRHNCDESYQADFELAKPLIEFVKTEMPYLSDQMEQLWLRETDQRLSKQ